MNVRDVEIGVFSAFAALDDDGRADKVKSRISGEIGLDLAAEKGLSLGEAFVDNDENFVLFAVLVLQKEVAKNGVGRIEHTFGEVHLVTVTHLNCVFATGHN